VASRTSWQTLTIKGSVGHWRDEKIDLARIYAEISKDASPGHLVDVAVFCDSDDTHTASISYFAYVRFERRLGSSNPSSVRGKIEAHDDGLFGFETGRRLSPVLRDFRYSTSNLF